MAEFRNVCVWDPAHPEHDEFKRIIADPILANPKVVIGNLAHDRADALRPADSMAELV
jgi:hypothetical protein